MEHPAKFGWYAVHDEEVAKLPWGYRHFVTRLMLPRASQVMLVGDPLIGVLRFDSPRSDQTLARTCGIWVDSSWRRFGIAERMLHELGKRGFKTLWMSPVTRSGIRFVNAMRRSETLKALGVTIA